MSTDSSKPTEKEKQQTVNAVRDIVASPVYGKNVRGRLAAALRLVDDTLHAQLAIDYAQHINWILEHYLPSDNRSQAALDWTKRFINGTATIEQVDQARRVFFDGHYGLSDLDELNYAIANEASATIFLAIRVCCQREWEELRRTVHVRYKPDAMSVAHQASYAVARHAGGQHWDDSDSRLKRTARDKGEAASKVETEWQIHQLLRRLNER